MRILYGAVSKVLIIIYIMFLLAVVFSCNKEDDNSTETPLPTPFSLFNLNDLPEIKLSFSKSQWDSLCYFYDLNPKNEEKVKANFKFIWNQQIISFDTVGIRIKGNTSRRRPSGSVGESLSLSNPDWHHFHLGIDFSVNKSGNRFAGREKLHLKWFKDDATYVREVYCYDLFRRYGVWTAPKSSYIRFSIKINEMSKEVYYGIYEMLEYIDKDFVKSRSGYWGSTEGNLWKCGWAGSTPADLLSSSSIGIEEVFLDAGQSKYYAFDLKTNKANFATAKAELEKFIYDLNTKNGTDFKIWIQQKMDIDLFLKTLAVNVIVGMWDDYWVNANNYYLYFASNGKVYFIPYDYDNALGTSLLVVNSGLQNPLDWAKTNSRPLIRKILAEAEFMQKYKNYLKELASPNLDYFASDKSMERIKKWQKFIGPYVSNDTGEDNLIEDKPAYWGNADFYRLLSGNDQAGAAGEANFFKTRCKTIYW